MAGLIVGLGIALSAGSPALKGDGTARFGDFAAYWVAGRAFWEGESPVDPTVVEQIAEREKLSQAFVVWNPPWFLAAIAPFSLLPFDVAAVGWCALNVALAVRVGLLLGARIGLSEFWSVVLTMTFVPIGICLGMSQWTILVLAGVVGYDHFRRTGRPVRAGVCLALASFKPHLVPIVWIAALLVGPWRERVRVWSAFVMTIGLTTALLVGARPALWTWFIHAWAHPAPSDPTRYFSATVPRWLQWLAEHSTGASSLPWVALMPFLVIALVILIRVLRGWNIDSLSLGDALLLSLLVVPYGWHYDQALLLPTYLLLAGVAFRSAHHPTWIGAALVAWELLFVALLWTRADESLFVVGLVGLAAIRVFAQHDFQMGNFGDASAKMPSRRSFALGKV